MIQDVNSVHKGYLSIDAASLRSLGFNRSGPIALDVSSIFNTETNGSKNWWKLVKSLLHSDSGGDRSIPPLQVENDMIQDVNSVHKGYLSIDAASLRSLGFNKSGPIALDASSIFNISSTQFPSLVYLAR
jgi:hypothetical protein